MVTTRSKLHRSWQARAPRWTCVLSVLALVGCALPRRDAPPKDGILRALVLSGGGAGGAFGAGALVGLSRRQERPQYDVVTGVSTGALIAPFAFAGGRR
jgi:predicted acylesterase/phospholipase RssA